MSIEPRKKRKPTTREPTTSMALSTRRAVEEYTRTRETIVKNGSANANAEMSKFVSKHAQNVRTVGAGVELMFSQIADVCEQEKLVAAKLGLGTIRCIQDTVKYQNQQVDQLTAELAREKGLVTKSEYERICEALGNSDANAAAIESMIEQAEGVSTGRAALEWDPSVFTSIGK